MTRLAFADAPRRCLLAAAIAVLLLGGCRPTPGELSERAEAAAAAGDWAAARVDLKSLLQAEPGNADARAALARASIQLGDLPSAEKEIRRSLALRPGAAGDPRRLTLATAVLGQERYAEVLEIVADFAPDSPGSDGDARMLVGRAYEGLGREAEAEAEFRAAMAKYPRQSAPRIALINLLFRGGRVGEADELIAAALAIDARDIAALVLRGRRILESRGPEVAEPHFERSLKLARTPAEESEVLVGLTEIRLQRNDLEGAERSVARLEKLTPGGLVGYFLRARLLAQQGAYGDAIARLQQILKADPDFLPAERLLGTVQYLNGNFEQAAMHIQRVVSRGSDPFLARLLAELRLRQNRPGEALQTLLPMMRDSPGAAFDQGLLVLAGQASLSLGDARAAGEFFSRGQQQYPNDERFRLGEISARLAGGDIATARTMLASLRASSTNPLAVDYLAVVTELADRQFDAAQVLAERLVAENPRVTWSHLLLATVRLAREDFDGARTGFERVIALEPGNKEALVNLARLDFRAGDDTAGAARLQQVIEADPDDFRPRLLLAEAHLASRRMNQALDQARAAVQLAPDSPATLNLLARAAAANGRWDVAREHFARITLLDPKNPRAWLNLARATVAGSKPAAIPESMKTALALAPGDPVVLATAGDLHMELGEVAAAIARYRSAYAAQPSADVAIRLCRARDAAQPGGACPELATWLEANPNDVAARLFRATLYQARGDRDAAIADFRRVVELDERQVQALNNLAWLLFEARDPRARSFAERAVKLQPASPAVLDTLGWILVAEGVIPRGLELLRDAARRSPRDPDVQYHLAFALYRNGDEAGALRTLDALLAPGQPFPQRAAAEKLQRSLRPGRTGGAG